MRTYSNYLLFEDVLDNLPPSSKLLNQVADLVISPTVNVVEEDCGTILGKVVDVSFELEGLVELATGLPLTRDRLTTLLSQGQYSVRIRELHSCTSTGGICRKCYEATYLGSTAPSIGTSTKLSPSLIYQTDEVIGNGLTSQFTLSQTSDDYYFIQVIHNGLVYSPTNYTLGYDTITFNTVLSNTDLYVVHFYKVNSEPLLGYISKTYSGSLLGIQPLPSLNLIIKESLYATIVSDGYIPMMIAELNNYPAIPATFLQYIENIRGKLEKIIFILLVYAVFGNITL